MRLTRAATSTLLLASTCRANDPLTPDKLEADIKMQELQHVLWNLNKIANDNGGTRAFGTPGYTASVDFVLERAQTRFGKHFNTYLQPFNHTFEQTKSVSVEGPKGETVFVASPQYNPGTPLPGGLTASLLNTPVDDATGSMCFESQWAGIDATGKLALIKRGTCAVVDKVKFAKAKGAIGVLIYNQEPGTDFAVPTLGEANIGLLVPVGIIPLEVASAWIPRLAAGQDLKATLLVDAIVETRESWNIISETKTGDPNKVIMVGAHLDSVQEGPGINDDGSGTAAILEIMGSVKQYDGYPHRIRFGWWGAEESGLIGSLFYTNNLSELETDKIKYYFNFDMIGSPNPMFGISQYINSGIGPELLADYLESKGKNVTYAEFDGRSDYAGFVELGIPTAGLFTGDGAPWDPCYHQACDNLDNINWEAFTVNAKAAARAVGVLANSLVGVPPRQRSKPLLRGRDARADSVRRRKALGEYARDKKKVTV
ncbi:peptidase family M28 [Lasiosphaeris hirsuta]|uniref:Peptide hydrolase n=1 Tax=Lasiosphaeris hirsuta TaxID=260670 RepID=A0AA40AY34_9PEZI|nr:peptidase family M28 [Lasiosphaeris hirsuta]